MLAKNEDTLTDVNLASLGGFEMVSIMESLKDISMGLQWVFLKVEMSVVVMEILLVFLSENRMDFYWVTLLVYN